MWLYIWSSIPWIILSPPEQAHAPQHLVVSPRASSNRLRG